MRIVLESTELAGWEFPPLKGVNISGQILYEPFPIVRALTRVFDRANALLTLAFTVRRQFESLQECESYMALHWTMIPHSGTLTLYCGTEDENEPVYMENAVLVANPQTKQDGISLLISYQFVAPKAASDNPPDSLLDLSMIKAGRTAITNGENAVEVEFDTPFSTAPVVVAIVAIPSGGDVIWASVDDSTVTVNGFTALLSAAVPATGYKLNWEAKQVSA